MLDQVADAFNRQDYNTASRLLQELVKQSPDNPWVQFYLARLQEVEGQLDVAEEKFRQLLRDTPNPKLAIQLRQSVQRLEAARQEERKRAIAHANAEATTHEPGFLVLESVADNARATAIQGLARVMNVDAYTARMLLPNRGWRLYRSGSAGELQVYGQELRSAGVPVCWASLPEIEQIQVFQVSFLQSVTPTVTAVCYNEQNQLGSLSFNWHEVNQRVEGMLPVFEQVLTLGYRDRLERKEETQDYVRFCDLHLPGRRSILRLQDTRYDFHRGISVIPKQAMVNVHDRNTIRTNWNYLMELLNRQLPEAPVWLDFVPFAETTADFTIPLSKLNPHLDLRRDTDYHWDAAFQLYSSLLFLRNQGKANTL